MSIQEIPDIRFGKQWEILRISGMGLPQSQLQPNHAVGYGQTQQCRENLSNDPWQGWWINRLKNNICKCLRGVQSIWLAAFANIWLWCPPGHRTLSRCCTTYIGVREVRSVRCLPRALHGHMECCLVLHMEAVLFPFTAVVIGAGLRQLYLCVHMYVVVKLTQLLSCSVHLIN